MMVEKLIVRLISVQVCVAVVVILLPAVGFAQVSPEFDVGQPDAGKAGQILLLILVLAILLETGLSTIFNWRLYLLYFEGKGLKTPIAVVAAFVFVQAFKIDAVAGVLSAFSGTTTYPTTTGGRILTALIVAGGSSAVFSLFEKLGLRNPIANQATAESMRDASHVKVQVTRDEIPAAEPITIEVDNEVVGAIEANKIRGGGMMGYKVKAGQRDIKVSGLKADGTKKEQSNLVTIAPGATVVESFKL